MGDCAGKYYRGFEWYTRSLDYSLQLIWLVILLGILLCPSSSEVANLSTLQMPHGSFDFNKDSRDVCTFSIALHKVFSRLPPRWVLTYYFDSVVLPQSHLKIRLR